MAGYCQREVFVDGSILISLEDLLRFKSFVKGRQQEGAGLCSNTFGRSPRLNDENSIKVSRIDSLVKLQYI